MRKLDQSTCFLIGSILLTLCLLALFKSIALVAETQSSVRSAVLESYAIDWSNRFTIVLRLLLLQILLLLVAVGFFWKALKLSKSGVIESCTQALRQLLTEEKISLPKASEFNQLETEFGKMAEIMGESKRRESAIFDKTADVICVLNIDGQFIRVSRICESIWGYKPEELVGRKLSEFVDQQCLDALENALGSQNSVNQISFENKFQKKNGAWLDIAWSAYWSVKEQGLFCVAHDITIRKQEEALVKASEEKLQRILQSLPVAVLMFDKNGKIEFANDRIAQLTGFSGSEVLDIEVSSLLPAVGKSLEEMAASPDEIHEGQLKRRGAPDAMVEYSLTCIYPEHDQEAKYLLAMLDVTERFEIEQAKRRFHAMISHDLRTPITSLQMILTNFKEGLLGTLNERGIYFAERGQSAASGLIVLINDLLDLEKMRHGKMKLDTKPEKIKKLFESAHSAVAAIATEKKIDIKLNVEDLMCIADGRRIIQVIINLLSNALKFSPAGSTIELSAQAEGSDVLVKVIDQGRGIPSEQLESIFETYTQVKASDGAIGSGLGLPICKSIVEQHSGKIGVESKEGQGSTFWFILPGFQAS